jgi:hypothetical protein
MEWNEILISVLAGLVTAIPLVVKLVEYIVKFVREKNWDNLVYLVMELMTEAEKLYDNGADRKTWVLEMVGASADVVKYDIDLEKVSVLIDSLCAMSKVVNFPDESGIEE